jgi:5-oxoprolinase (ATP-hydrolysing)
MYMQAIQDSAELATRNLFKSIAKRFNSTQVSAVDYMDDGTPIQLQVSINEENGSSTFDFTGTGPEVYGTYLSAILHNSDPISCCLRFQRNQD